MAVIKTRLQVLNDTAEALEAKSAAVVHSVTVWQAYMI